ncbi:hypothetical protein CYMTET_28827 [Cymbomonas tetramitiformis]|uniref:Uncharacterized protein n=1 Tax=Cymbomonas tetramitiformis TaxID=36881 RepID=A0AAE0FM58_9CHLO|nr:hypothetical protein CYMTET_28827 [Cymbomonas tetramitiformis]
MDLAEEGVATLTGVSGRVASLLEGAVGMGGARREGAEGDVGGVAGGVDTCQAPQIPGAHPDNDDHLQQVARQHTASHQLPCPRGEVVCRAGTANDDHLLGRRRPVGELSATGRAWNAQAYVKEQCSTTAAVRVWSASLEIAVFSRGVQCKGFSPIELVQGVEGCKRGSVAGVQDQMGAIQYIILSPLAQPLGIPAVSWVCKFS